MPEPASLDARDPRTLGGHPIVRRLGSGAQGIVYLARTDQGEHVAIKVLHGEWARDPELRARFAREAEAARRVDAFCTARILGARPDGDAPYIISEYVPGPSLRDAVTADGPYHRDRLYRLAVGTATALAAIHQAGIVHRDFKPANVLLGPDGPRVIDFGVAQAGPPRDTGGAGAYVTVGTPSYMAPEQATGGPVGPAADLFAWAEVIVFAATGRPPFGDDTPMAVAARLVTEDPDLTGVDASLRDIVAACLARDPAKRPTASEVLLRLLGHPAQPFTPSVLTEGARAAATGGTTGPRTEDPAPRRRAAGSPEGRRTDGPAERHGGHRWRAAAAVLTGMAVAGVAVTPFLLAHQRPEPTVRTSHDGPTGEPAGGVPAGAWRGTIPGPGDALRLVVVRVAAGARTARLSALDASCTVPLRRTASGAYTAPESDCRWARGARLTGGPTPALRVAGHTIRLARPAGPVPEAYAGHWHGRIRPSGLTVDLTLGTGRRPGVWRSPGYACTGALTVWQYGDGRLVLVNTRHGACQGRPDTLVLTRTASGRLTYRQVSGSGNTAQRGILRRG